MRNLFTASATACSILICLLSPCAKAALSQSTSTNKRTIHRRAFVVESLAKYSAATMIVGTTATISPNVAHSEEEEGGFDSFIKAAQERSLARQKEAAEKSRGAAERRKQAAEKSKNGKAEEEEDGGFVFSTKVEEIQADIIERKEKVREFDKQETIRSEENEFVKELKARSKANKEQYMKEAMRADKLSPKQFQDNLNRPSYVGVTRSDGSIKMITSQQFEELEKANRIKVDYESTINKNGKEFVDYSKRVLLLLDDDDGQQSETPTGTETATESVTTPTTEVTNK